MSDDIPSPDTGTRTGDYARYRLRRDAGGVRDWFAARWHRRRFRWLTYAVVTGLLAFMIGWTMIARGLPDARTLLEYQPALPTVVRGANGEPVHSFARDRRVQLDYNEFPPQLIHAYLAAEDKTFFSHGGIDYLGFAGAVFDYVSKLGSGDRAKGGSTITQQVAKNILIGDDYSITRKLKEMVLARRIEGVLTKPQILELYLNEIPLGRQSFGVQAAARAYFDKDVGDLDLNEAAFLAILPKAPEKYGRPQNRDAALARRNFVLGQMEDNNWITAAQRTQAASQPLGLVSERGSPFKNAGGYYMEEVRRELLDKFGENAEDGPLSVYAGGLWVRTPYDPAMQAATTNALRAGLLRFDAGHAWSGNLGTIEPDDQWLSRLKSSYVSIDYEDWRIAAVLANDGGVARLGFANGTTGRMTAGNARGVLGQIKPGDLIAVKPMAGDEYGLRNIPKISGGMVVEDPHSGRIYAMQGGFSNRLSSFNRATQAERQPGSTIKPFVYSAALDSGMTPASIIVDQPFCVYQGAGLGEKCFKNYSGGYAGPKTMRWGIEQSRNLMTVAAANQTGMDKVVATIKRMGIGDYKPYLSMALGAGETTVLKMTNAFSMLANAGRELQPRVIDYVQDRNGKVVWPAKWKACEGCNADDWDGKPMPRFVQTGKQVLDPLTAYQMVHILEGVVTRGTAQRLRVLDRPMMGKTGTTNGPKEVWFVGGTPDLVTGVYVGYDTPKSLGGWAQGGRISAPIALEFFQKVIPKDAPRVPFVAPADIRMVRIDRNSGKRVYGVFPDSENGDPKAAVIWEAFKPETEPKRTIRKEEIPEPKKVTAKPVTTNARPKQKRDDQDFLEDQGGIY